MQDPCPRPCGLSAGVPTDSPRAGKWFGGQVIQQLSAIEHVQQQRTLLRVNELADRCFRECIGDFGITKRLRSHEETCLSRCVEKYLLLSAAVGNRFTEELAAP